MRRKRVSKRQSIMSKPTFIRMPARTAWGIGPTYLPAPRTNISRIVAHSTPETRVRPPARMFATVPVVAPAPGTAPMRPASTLPRPTPISSRFGSWCSRVIESAMSAVSRLLMEPMSAIVIAGNRAPTSASTERSGTRMLGMPVGTSPMTGASPSHTMPTRRADDQRRHGGRQELPEARRPHDAHRDGERGEGQDAEVDVAHDVRPRADRFQRSPQGDRRAQEGQALYQDDDRADARRESRDHRIGRVGHEAAEPRRAQQYLYQARQGSDRESLGDAVRVAGHDDRHGHRQRRGGAGYLGSRPPKDRREETNRDGPVEAGDRSQTRRHPEGQRQRESYNRCCHPPGGVITKRLEVVLHAGSNSNQGQTGGQGGNRIRNDHRSQPTAQAR